MTYAKKKPVVVEAVQVLNNDYNDNPFTFREVPQWLQDAIDDEILKAVFKGEDYWYIEIDTLEGVMTASPDDWIIRGVNGELYPCKPDIFEKTYDIIDLSDNSFT